MKATRAPTFPTACCYVTLTAWRTCSANCVRSLASRASPACWRKTSRNCRIKSLIAVMDSLPPIPTPPALRWREFRIQILPVVIFIAIISMIVIMWKNFVQPSGVAGEAESVKAKVINLQDGVVAELHVGGEEQILKVGAQFEAINRP